MSLKSLNLLFLSLLLLSGTSTLAQQQAPPAPAAPKAPAAPLAPEAPEAPEAPVAPIAPDAPEAPEAPNTFSFFFQGGSFLGVHAEDINKENMSRYGIAREPRGVGITKVAANSPAESAGLRERDVILRFENEPVTSVRKLNRLINEVAPEHAARLTISRGGDEKDLTVTLGKRSDFNTGFGLPGQRWEDLDKLRDFKLDDKNNNFTFVFGNNRRIGVATTQLTKQLADYFGIAGGKGLLITSVREDSPADKAGLRAGDVITEADNQQVATIADLMRVLSRKDEGEMSLVITRDKSRRTVRLVPERGGDSNSVAPGVYLSPQAMQIELPKIEILNLPRVVMPLKALPKIRVNVPTINIPAKVLRLPSTPL